MSKKMLIVAGLVVLLVANLALSAMAAKSRPGEPAWSPQETRPVNGGGWSKWTPAVGINGECEVTGSSTCPPATPGG